MTARSFCNVIPEESASVYKEYPTLIRSLSPVRGGLKRVSATSAHEGGGFA